MRMLEIISILITKASVALLNLFSGIVAIGTFVWSIFEMDAYEWGAISAEEFNNGLWNLLIGIGIALLLRGGAILVKWILESELRGEGND